MSGVDDRPGLEKFYREFLHAEIAIGITYARLAMTAYTAGHALHGNRIAAMACNSKAEVARWLEDAEEYGWNMAEVTAEYQCLRAALMQLPPSEQRAA